MKTRFSVVFLVAAIVLLSFVAMQVMAAAEKGETGKESAVTLKQLPKAVRATLVAKAKGGKIQEIEKNVTKGVVTYSADVAFGKKIFDIEIAANGKFIGKDEDKPAPKAKAPAKAEALEPGESNVTFDSLPAAVKATFNKWAAGGKINGVEKSGTGAKTVYEADVTKGGKAYDVSVGASGKFISAIPEPATTTPAASTTKPEAPEKETE